MDRGLWISWYDVEEADRAAYLGWLHAAYLPALARSRGVLWVAHYACVPRAARRASAREAAVTRTADAAVPAGSQFILLAGAGAAHAFGNPSPAEYHAALPEADRTMLALRRGERVNVMAEAGRVEGPAAAAFGRDPTTSPCIQLGSFNCAPDHEEKVLAWYTKWRMRAMTATPGCVRFRTLASVAGWAKRPCSTSSSRSRPATSIS